MDEGFIKRRRNNERTVKQTTTDGDHRHKQKEQEMKTVKHLLAAATIVATLNMTLSAQTAEPNALPQPPKNRALLASPRYLEAHPELSRMRTPDRESRTLHADRLAMLTANKALANSPRFRELHPELRWTPATAERLTAKSAGERATSKKLTENKALAASPRFKEAHPELLRGERSFEIAPLK